MPKRSRTITLKLAKKECWKQFSIYIRLRDCLKTTGTSTEGLCVTCGKKLPFKKLQAGHFIPGRNNAILYNERHVHAQCWKCNAPASLGGLNGNPLQYRRKIIELYGQGADERMEAEAKQIKQYKIYEILALIEEFKHKSKQIDKYMEGK